ncbi:DUF1403 family protein [Mesorhizobium sp. B4-1-3]|uniref:DUF1403 family protein n=1 Tax=Mesorhizobium sp. B4-1-3 TaxID=2589889 RepID=UPI001FF03ABA|nr:DUF1403 family protein [Mesorhizobium sp. B4-1-3]
MASLDVLARAQTAWVSAWRQRLALNCAAASMRLAGRAEDRAALRDAWHLRPTGADPDPAGAILAVWRQLAVQPVAAGADRLEKIVDQLGLHWDGASLADLSKDFQEVAASPRPEPFAAAAMARPRRSDPPRCRACCLVAVRPGAGAKPALAAAAAAVDGAGFWHSLPR